MRPFGWIFLALFRLDFSNSGKEYNRWKALLGMTVLQGYLLVCADLWLKMFTGRSAFLRLPRSALVVIYLAIVLANYFAFLHGDRTDQLLEELANRSPRERLLGLTLAWLFILGTLALLVFSFWRFSLWAPTQR
jgi:hypothetical protein